jgi:hypothetical protein
MLIWMTQGNIGNYLAVSYWKNERRKLDTLTTPD